MRRLAVVVAVASLFPIVASARTPSPAQQLDRLESQTQRIRQLRQLHPVKAVFPSNAAFDRALRQEMAIESPGAEIQVGQQEDVLLGLIAKGDSLRRILFHGIGGQVAGFYDYHRRTLYLRAGGRALSPAWRWTIAHEYTHALQDEHYHLARLLPNQSLISYRNSDVVAAHHALTEGDAVNTQVLYIQRTYSASDMQRLIFAQQQLAKSPSVPKALERGFNFPYTSGLAFVRALYASGGMAGVDAAYRRLPRSTFEIMHPGAYLRRWRPVRVALHTVEGFADWQRADDDVLGAFNYNLLIWQRLGSRVANAVTDGYRGDRYVFLTRGTDTAMLLKSVWASAKAARFAERELVDTLRLRYRHHPRVESGAGVTAIAAGQTVYFRRQRNRLTIAYASSPLIARQLGTAQTH